MPQLIQPSKLVTKEIITKDGECIIHLTLDLNINVNSAGVAVTGASKPVEDTEDKVEWVVPQFTSGQKVSFGKKK